MSMESVYVIIMSWADNPMKPPFKHNAKSFDDAQQLFRNCTNTKLYDEQKSVNRPPDSSLGFDSILEFNNQRKNKDHVHIYGWYKYREEAEAVLEKKIEETKDRNNMVGFSTTHYYKTGKLCMCSYGVCDGYQVVWDPVLDWEQDQGMEMRMRRITKTVYYWWQIEKVEMPLLKVEDVAKAEGHEKGEDGDTDDEEFTEAIGLIPGSE